jgi:Polyketide cyclase / dehydrase and lipid transport
MPQHPVKPPNWIDSAPIVVSEQIEIDAAPDVVWAHIIDHASWPTWFSQLDEVQPLGTPSGVGGGRRVIVGKLPLDEEFTAWDENEHFAFAVVASKLPILAALAESVRLEAVGDDRCLVTYRQGVEGRRGCGWLMTQVWKRAAKGLPGALVNLKQRVESETH